MSQEISKEIGTGWEQTCDRKRWKKIILTTRKTLNKNNTLNDLNLIDTTKHLSIFLN